MFGKPIPHLFFVFDQVVTNRQVIGQGNASLLSVFRFVHRSWFDWHVGRCLGGHLVVLVGHEWLDCFRGAVLNCLFCHLSGPTTNRNECFCQFDSFDVIPAWVASMFRAKFSDELTPVRPT